MSRAGERREAGAPLGRGYCSEPCQRWRWLGPRRRGCGAERQVGRWVSWNRKSRHKGRYNKRQQKGSLERKEHSKVILASTLYLCRWGNPHPRRVSWLATVSATESLTQPRSLLTSHPGQLLPTPLENKNRRRSKHAVKKKHQKGRVEEVGEKREGKGGLSFKENGSQSRWNGKKMITGEQKDRAV